MRKISTTGSGRVNDRPYPELEDLYRAEYESMVRLAFTLLGSDPQAEEVVQDAFVEIAPRVSGLERPGGYLRTAVVSRCYSALRKSQVRRRHQNMSPGATHDGPSDLNDVLARLPVEQRVVVVLKYYGGYNASEIARMVGFSSSTVRSHLRRGLKALRRELEDG